MDKNLKKAKLNYHNNEKSVEYLFTILNNYCYKIQTRVNVNKKGQLLHVRV